MNSNTDLTPVRIELTAIDPSPFQHRRRFDPEELRELADSIKKHGQLDDAIVRPKEAGRFELIAGERRMRAMVRLRDSNAGGFTDLRCKVREMSDDDARELVIIQQLQHEDWTITEEAEGYAALLALKDEKTGEPRFTHATLAARIDRKESHIRELVAILSTPEEMREAVDAKLVSKRAAAYVASVADPEKRGLAAKMVLHPRDKTSPLTAKETEELLKRDFQRSLQGAPWKLSDAKLLPDVPSCEKCALRTGNMPIYADLLRSTVGGGGSAGGISPYLCTEPKCFLRKWEAVEHKLKAEAVRRGCEIMSDEDAKRLFDHDGELLDSSGYVDRDGKPDPTLCHHYNQDRLPTWRKLIATRGVQTGPFKTVKAWLAKNPETGELHELIKWEDAVRCINEGCRATGEDVFFKAGEEQSIRPLEGQSDSTEGIKPGENIFTPEPKDGMWDKDEARRTAQEAKEKVKADAERRLALMAAMHGRIVEVLGTLEGESSVTELFVQHQLQTVGCEAVIDELCVHYGLMPETEESLGDLVMHYFTLEPRERAAFVIMIMVRRFALSFGADSSSVDEWKEALGMAEPAVVPAAETPEAVVIADSMPAESEPLPVMRDLPSPAPCGDKPKRGRPPGKAKKKPAKKAKGKSKGKRN